ncbi:killer cell lectin-like receptor subfamily F member 1 isoform X1 [Hemicordylus capensis]|uniref:killer cell lectin-like receptor subfamily F member 1 isoform X1 n=1 Tax=Hemicordylus capensis TaxID=884348 RepID=UPI0023046B60|nr:killer cell lectin-like receptor subfamily F member 1 isoform X1 [Hemicordylus capensis]
MADELFYADLHLPSQPNSERQLHSADHFNAFEGSCRHKAALWIGWAGNIILLVTVIVLVFQGSFHKGETAVCTNITEDNTGNQKELPVCSSCSKNITLQKYRLCGPSEGSTKCKLCPMGWVPQRGKCYWFSKEKNKWTVARDHCSSKEAQMLMIQDLEEKEVTRTIIQGTSRFWTGLHFSASRKQWIWVDDSLFDQTLFSLPLRADGTQCGAFKDDQIRLELCSDEFKWICEKEAVLI